MDEARLRALAPISGDALYITPVVVEMDEARLRALTPCHFFYIHIKPHFK